MMNEEKENLYSKTKTRLDKFSYKELIRSQKKWFWYNLVISYLTLMGLIFFDNTPTTTIPKLIAVLYSLTWIVQLYYLFLYPFFALLPEDIRYKSKYYLNKRYLRKQKELYLNRKYLTKWSIENWYWIVIWILLFLVGGAYL